MAIPIALAAMAWIWGSALNGRRHPVRTTQTRSRRLASSPRTMPLKLPVSGWRRGAGRWRGTKARDRKFGQRMRGPVAVIVCLNITSKRWWPLNMLPVTGWNGLCAAAGHETNLPRQGQRKVGPRRLHRSPRRGAAPCRFTTSRRPATPPLSGIPGSAPAARSNGPAQRSRPGPAAPQEYRGGRHIRPRSESSTPAPSL